MQEGNPVEGYIAVLSDFNRGAVGEASVNFSKIRMIFPGLYYWISCSAPKTCNAN